MPKRVGVVLSGCGLYDGSDVQETVLALAALASKGARVELLAPDRPQFDVVDHATTQVDEASARNVLAESCRLARGRVTPLDRARPEALDALLLPGGFGTAKNLVSGFATVGAPREPWPEVRALIGHFLEHRKPIGTISLGEAVVAAVLGEPLREDPFSAPPGEIRADDERNLLHTSGFMGSDDITEVANGIQVMVSRLLAGAAAGGTRP